jgi:hypothetical protein
MWFQRKKECYAGYYSEQQQFNKVGVLLRSAVTHELRVLDQCPSSGWTGTVAIGEGRCMCGCASVS